MGEGKLSDSSYRTPSMKQMVRFRYLSIKYLTPNFINQAPIYPVKIITFRLDDKLIIVTAYNHFDALSIS